MVITKTNSNHTHSTLLNQPLTITAMICAAANALPCCAGSHALVVWGKGERLMTSDSHLHTRNMLHIKSACAHVHGMSYMSSMSEHRAHEKQDQHT